MTATPQPSPYDVDVAQCRSRQQRLLAEMKRLNLDLVVVTQIEHVQWLAGPRFMWYHAPAAALAIDGRLTLVAPDPPAEATAADEVAVYESRWLCTLRNEQRQASSDVLLKALAGNQKPRRVGAEFSSCGQRVAVGLGAELIDIEPDLYRLRRRKDPDELARLRKAIAGTGAMYVRAREIVSPGVNELDVFNELQSAAVREFGEMMIATGNDYRANAFGGPPRDRRVEEGELYILDLGPAFRGYHADNCRTLAVGGRPTDKQQEAWRHVAAVFPMVEKRVKAGVRCRDFFTEVQAHMDEKRPWTFGHHLGHGIGLFPHEAPHLNPHWDDTFQAGEVITVEPGLYGPELRTGIRLENDYLVTEQGVELLSDFPLEL